MIQQVVDAFPPGPTNWREALTRFNADAYSYLLELIRSYGEFCHMKLGTRHMYLICDPQLLHHVFVEAPYQYEKTDHTKDGLAVIGQGLLVSSGSYHKRHRRTLQPLFTPTRVVEYAQVVVEQTRRMLTTWPPGSVRDLASDISELTFGIICDAIFGVQSDTMRTEFTRAMAVVQSYSVDTLGHRASETGRAELDQAAQSMDSIVRQVLAHAEPNGRNFLSLMTQAVDPESGQSMSASEIRDEALTLLLAGHETTANALVWMWYLLAKHPSVEQRMFDEIQRVVGNRPVEYADLAALQFTTWILKEVLRFYHPAWLVGRQVPANQTLVLGGYPIPAHSVVAAPIHALHRNPRYYPDPDEFKPERFSAELPKYTYIPFGLGPRVCIGQHFATMEALLILVTVAQQFKIQFAADYVAQPTGMLTLKPKQAPLVTIVASGTNTSSSYPVPAQSATRTIAQDQTALPQRPAQHPPIPVAEARILIVEDNMDNLAATKKLLAYSGAMLTNCLQKTSGTGVVQFAEKVRLDLILLDLKLPHEDGYAILRELRSRPKFAHLRVVVITGQAHSNEMRRAQDAGFDGFIGKPLRVDRFPDQLRRILNGEQVWECH